VGLWSFSRKERLVGTSTLGVETETTLYLQTYVQYYITEIELYFDRTKYCRSIWKAVRVVFLRKSNIKVSGDTDSFRTVVVS
jgi:hypothetical protein